MTSIYSKSSALLITGIEIKILYPITFVNISFYSGTDMRKGQYIIQKSSD